MNKYRDWEVSDPGWLGGLFGLLLIAVFVWVCWTTMGPGRKKQEQRAREQAKRRTKRAQAKAKQREAG